MASLGNPRSWIPYMNGKDCSQGFCSLNCPQWCNIVHPPPPPFEYLDENDSRPNFSPLVIAIIGILATAFLLVSYYAIISKYCGRRENQDHPNDLQEDHSSSLSEPWHASTIGLDESLIKSITVCKYKRGDGLVQVTDCSVCLSEFQDDESVRLLPKCSHAFHLPCIDTWLKSHSTCPLCRATIFPFNASAPHQVPAMMMELPSRDETSSENGNAAVGSGNEIGVVEEEESVHGTPPSPPPPPPPPSGASKPPSFRAFSDLGSMQGRHRIIEIRDDELEVYESIGRSVSMGHSFQSGGARVSVAHVVVHMNQEQHSQAEGCSSTESGPSKRSRGESSKWSYKRKVLLHCVLSPIAMKRSFSSGRFSLSTSHRARQGIVPVAV